MPSPTAPSHHLPQCAQRTCLEEIALKTSTSGGFVRQKTSHCISSYIRTWALSVCSSELTSSLPPVPKAAKSLPLPSTVITQYCQTSPQGQTPNSCSDQFLGLGARREGLSQEGAFSALHPLIFFTSLMHFPSVTRTPKHEDSDPASYRLRKEMEEFHLAVGSDGFGNTSTAQRWTGRPAQWGQWSTQSTVSFYGNHM